MHPGFVNILRRSIPAKLHLVFFSPSVPRRRAENFAILISSSVFSLTRLARAASSWAIISSGVASNLRFLSYSNSMLIWELVKDCCRC